MTGGNEKTTFNMSAELVYKNQFIERYSFEDAGKDFRYDVASQTNIKLSERLG